MAKILIAEDNDLNLKLMYDILCSQGYDVEVAVDGQETVEKLKKGNYDLLLLDLQMPVISGFEVLEAIKLSNFPIKTIVVSACAMSAEIDRAKALGCIDFITKPIRIEKFLEQIENVLN